MQKISTREIRELYKISSAGPEFRLDDNTFLLEKCCHIDSGREYSLRTFRKKLKSDACSISMIKELLELDHPNIMKIYDVFEIENCIQIVFQKCEGTTLFHEIQRIPGSRLDEETASKLLFQILSAVKYLHQKNLLFRNLSLDNLLISENSFGYDVKIIDFGERVSTTKKSYLQEMLGEGYDYFSIGLIAFSLVTGVHPIVVKGDEEELAFNLQTREDFQSLTTDCQSFILACLSNISIFSTFSGNLQEHPWLHQKNLLSSSSDILPDTLIRLKDYQKKSSVERILTLAVSQSLSVSKLGIINLEFRKFDNKYTGEITYSDFKKALSNISEEEVQQIFSAINISRTNTITYHEFICALMTDSIVTERNLRSTFLQCCCSNQGYLMLTDITKYFDSDCSMEYIHNLFSEAGLGTDSFLSYNRFKKYVGLHCHCKNIKASVAVVFSAAVATSTTSSNSVRKDLSIPSILSTSTNTTTTTPSAATTISIINNEGDIARRRLQTLTENIVTVNTLTDVRSVYIVEDSSDEDLLGSGASGQVYKCRHRITGVTYAVKSIAINNTSKDQINYLRQEIQIMSKLDHPNILRLHESYESSTHIYLILDLCTGGELLDRLYDQPSCIYSEKDACKLVYNILGAVRYCHDHGVAHRDLKLENFLLVSEKGDAAIKLIDFGLSCYFTSSQYMTESIGTPYYIAPEVLDKRYNEKADIWSIGVIAYMLMTGTPLFNGEENVDILRAVAEGQVVYCSKFKTISTPGQDFINSCLVRDPIHRLSAQQAHMHVWFQSLQNDKIESISPQIIFNLQHFSMRRPLARFFLFTLAYSQKEEYLVEVNNAFTAINTSKSGEIRYNEFKNALLNNNFSLKDITTLSSILDVERTGKITYHQFIAAAMNLTDLRERCWKMAFYKISNHKDSFTIGDVEILLGRNATTKVMDELLLDWGNSITVPITFTDFKNIINSVSSRPVITKPVATIPISVSYDNMDSIKYVLSTDSSDCSPLLSRPPNNSTTPNFRRNIFRQISSSLHLSTSVLTSIQEVNEIKSSLPDIVLPVDGTLVGTNDTVVKVQKPSSPLNEKNNHQTVNDTITNSSTSSSTSSTSGTNRMTWIFNNSIKSPKPSPPVTTTKKLESSSCRHSPAVVVSTPIKPSSSTAKFHSANDLTLLPSIITTNTTKVSPRKGSLGNRLRPSK